VCGRALHDAAANGMTADMPVIPPDLDAEAGLENHFAGD